MSYAYNDSYYEPRYENTPSDFGWVREEDVADVTECKILLHKLIEAVYKTGNIASIEDSLECLADALDVEIPDSNTKIKITSSEKIYSDIKMFAVA